jgi:phosphoglycolate phosphatase-like HAD superfamily hydrolase
VQLPALPATRRWIETETRLGNPALADAVQKANDPELTMLLAWSKAVNESVERIVHHVPPFPAVRESIQRLFSTADLFVCSATPNEALTREWIEHGLAEYVARICGQEVGSKKEILAIAKQYEKGRSLMIGDAPGDLSAARANDVLFYPINPGHEEASWERFHDEALSRFLDGNFAGEYESALIREFETFLPKTPPWKS